MSQGLSYVYNTLLLPCVRSQLLQLHGGVFACRSSNLGSIPSWGMLNIFNLKTHAHMSHQPTTAYTEQDVIRQVYCKNSHYIGITIM